MMPSDTAGKPDKSSDEFAGRDLDWTTRQQGLASDPARSAWVSANAGSGKTHVLSQRVIRLLLAGCRPSAILCLTYTKAAASEMANRVFERLAEWTRLDDAALSEKIIALGNPRPDALQLAFARQLFARALETPGGLKIQTIHAFCEAVLHQFPLEANVAGHFEVMDDAATARLLDEVQRTLLTTIASGTDENLTRAFEIVLEAGGEWGLDGLLSEIVRKRQPIRDFLAAAKQYGGVETVLYKALQLSPGESEEDIYERVWPLPSLNADDISLYCDAAAGQKAVTPKKFAAGLEAIAHETDPKLRFEGLLELFLKQDGTCRSYKNAATAGIDAVVARIQEKLEDAGAHMVMASDRLRTLRMVRCTQAALELAGRFDQGYEALKRRNGSLDFDDLVSRTAHLLERDGAGPWVHYKLDQGIDHILVDEAQDTSPAQWAVVAKLAEEFFVGDTSRVDNRTLFAVGDEKQSIYSFQGARPELFMTTGRIVQKRAFDAEKHFDALNLHLSFRSTNDILAAVDTVFASEQNRKGLTSGNHAVAHASNRDREPGMVDVWEMIGKQAADDHVDWKTAFDATPESAPPAQLARRVAATIRHWIDQGETLVEKGERRPITAGDILVLVRKRDGFVGALLRELKRNHIPVAGADRLKLVEHIAIEDLMALGRVMLLPQDDLSLCAVLKSPLFDFSEDDIYRLAAERADKASVFAHLGHLAGSEGAHWAKAHEYLTGLMAQADRKPVFDFYAQILGRDGGRNKFLSRLGSEASDILDEFLSFALEHEGTSLPGLQAFLTTLEARSPEIKRELEQGRDEIRIMTVHASKGLEAPIVFLVDSGGKPANAMHVPKLQELPLDKTLGPLPPAILWVPGKPFANATTEELKARILELSEEEYRRLLYVGMTRAADRLVVCGYHGLNQPAYQHWHNMIAQALGEDAACSIATYEAGGQDWQGLHFEVSQPHPASDVQSAIAEPAKALPLPGGLRKHLARPVHLPRPLVPSAAGAIIEAETGAHSGRSPLLDPTLAVSQPLERGRIIHRLLQLLPQVDPQERQPAAVRYLQRLVGNWSDSERQDVVTSVLAILNDNQFSKCFAPGSQAEVSLMGTLKVAGEERALSARIDRIVVADDRVLIVDYKTNRPPPRTLDQVPQSYRAQLALYRALLQPLYPGLPVEAALLFTEAPLLIVLDSDVLDAAFAQIVSPDNSDK
ncbi:MAG: double-strand break repair helicase AddA [Rhizobiaceae bacterium]|nr:double-strand break repair helicase AddA [Rhizobiaceae bacterium]